MTLHPRDFIVDPFERIEQYTKVLCGNVGILADEFIYLSIARKGVNCITREIIELLHKGFFELLKLPQSARAEAAETYLEPLDPHMHRNGVYLHIIRVPPNASFWKKYAYAFNLDEIDTSNGHTLSYIGSTVRTFRKRVRLEHMRPEHRKKNPSLHYAAMDEPGAIGQWFLIGATQNSADQATIRILEAVAIATMHTFGSLDYTAILSSYGIVEKNVEAFGLNRTGVVRDYK